MNSVESLISNPFCGRSLIDKAEIKRLGRTTPNLKIEQSVSSKKRTFTRTFNPELYNKHTWLCGCEIKNALYCFPCLLFGGEDSWTKIGFTDLNHSGDRIKKHTSSAKHIKNVLQYSLFGTVNVAAQLSTAYRRNIELHNEQVRHNRYILNIIINCVRFCGAFELALRGHDESTSSSNPGVFRGLIDFSSELDGALKQHLKKASVFKGTSKTIQNEILQTMFTVCQEEISKEIENADYLSIIADETSDVSNKFQMAIVFRYILKGKPVERFWDFLMPSDHDAKALSKVILTELEKHVKGKRSKLIAQTYDGASVMSGSSNGVQAIIKKTYEHAAYVHCYAHQLNLVMLNSASANKNVRIFFANLQGICTFFSSSPQRSAILDQIVKKRLPRSAPTRWNFNSRVVCTVFEYKDGILETMETLLNESRNVSTTNQASGYVKIIKSKSFVSWLNLFYKIMPHVDLLFGKFQTRQIDAVIAKKFILSFETKLTEIINSITLDDIEPTSSNSKRHKLDDSAEFSREAKEVCDIIICQAKERFSFTGHLVAASLFFPEEYGQYSTCFPEEKFKETIKNYPFFIEQKLRTELTVIYDTEELKSVSGLLVLYDFISQNIELSETFSETLKLIKILITIPMASAEAERCFSTLKRIKTFLRNTMCQKRLSALAMLSKERDLIESIPDFNQRVIDKFATTKDRRMDFLFK
ncbi:unnamed protein product [Psylliodes chrysocephalus]|uniref:Zinc finger MYM-type protein 1 n=1 Tax=Psylliodes chrysocephalus TaxID=3402493 RepID=A0A9P0GAQ5_9CUCU|nr:unnamed protein product [Psylliodes chrysocephala]